MRAREAATLLLATLDRDEMVPRFLDMYAAENRRPGRADQPAHYREQLETIRREAITGDGAAHRSGVAHAPESPRDGA